MDLKDAAETIYNFAAATAIIIGGGWLSGGDEGGKRAINH